METPNKLSYWREVWRVSSGFTQSLRLRAGLLRGLGEQVEKGLCYFRSSSTDSYNKFISSQSMDVKIVPILDKLHQFMDLECHQTWDVFCHYLISQYHGTPEIALQNFSFVDVRIGQLLLDVWTFYNSERMFMLKQIKLMLEYKDSSHLYNKEFNSIIQEIGYVKLKTSLIKQFEYLIKENPPTKVKNGENVTHQMQLLWMERNLREQVEVLQLILLVVNEDSLTILEFKKLLLLFKEHGFGRQSVYSRHLQESHQLNILKIIYSEVVLFYKFVCDAKSVAVNSVIKSVKNDIESELIRLQHNDEHGALLLAWLLLLVQDPQDGDMLLMRYQHFGTKALQLRVFDFLYNLVTNPMFSDNSKCSLIVRNAIQHILELLCDKFDADRFVAVHSNVIELSAELLRDERVAHGFWKNVNSSEPVGVGSLWNAALEFFPFDMKSLSLFVQGLSKAGSQSLQNLMKELEALPVFTEQYRPGMIGLTNLADELMLTEDYFPYGRRSFPIKKKSLAVIVDNRNTTLIHFRNCVSFWKVLQLELQSLLDENICRHVDVMARLEGVVYGIRALACVLQALPVTDELPDSLIEPCEAVFEVLVKFAHLQTPLMPLIAACLDVSTALVSCFTQRVYLRLVNIRLLPSVELTNLSHEEYVNGVSFETGILGMYLVNVEQQCGEYLALNAYLDLLFAFYDYNIDREITIGALLPGLLFILREIFPQMSQWFYKSASIKNTLTLKCITFLQKISQLSPEQTTRPTDLLLNRICILSLLMPENGMALLKLVSIGDQNIQNVMENESNWIHGPGMNFIKIVQVSMAVLMQVLRLKSLVSDGVGLCPLEHLIYTQPRQKDALKIVPVVAGYINHVFNVNLPNTACRLLRRFALDFQMSLLICLDMSSHQIRTMFLERLRDESESIPLKTVILEFVAACIEKQPGLTEAFFKVSHPQDQKRIFAIQTESQDTTTDGILTYMAEYLAAVKKDPNSLYSPLLSRVMGLFHALWKTNMQVLVKDLRENRDFWEYLCSPLFHHILPDVRAYAQIFNMMAIELFLFQGKLDKSLKAALDKIFNNNTACLQKWIDFIFSFEGRQSMRIIDEIPTWLSLLTSWKDLISIVMKFSPSPVPLSNKCLMVDHCLKTLIGELESMDDGRTIVIISEMYVIFFSNWKEDCIDDRRKYISQIANLLKHAAAGFEDLHVRAKNAILSICTLSLNMVAYDCRNEKVMSHDIICSVCSIVVSEMKRIDEKTSGMENDQLNTDKQDLDPLILAFRLLEQCIDVFKNDFCGWDTPFISSRIVNKLVQFVSTSTRTRSLMKQTLAAFNCLTSFAHSSISSELLYCDISHHLWLKLLPPKELSQNNGKQSDSLWLTNEWLQVYKCGIDFVTAMLEYHGSFFASDAILFVGVHEDYLNESILLMRQTLDMDVLSLTSSALYYISELVKYEGRWRQEHYQSMVATMRSISVCFHYCITMILRPKGIHISIENPSALLTQDETDNVGPSPKVTTTLNKLLELMHLCAICLKAFSPDLLSLLADPCPDLTKWQPLMELQFSAPKLSDDPYPQLTFGTVLSAVCLLVRSLNHNYHAEETFLNSIRRSSGRRGSSRRRISGGPGDDRVERRRTLRSDSVTSISSSTTTSTVTIGGSWLAALDKKYVLITLENVLTLLASQALFTARDPAMSSRDKQLIRRELCTELPVFHDFVRKRVLDLSHPRNHLCRKKFGNYPLLRYEDENKSISVTQEGSESILGNASTPTPPPPQRLVHDSMRVSVVRKLHLDKAKTKLSDTSSTPKKFIPLTQYSPSPSHLIQGVTSTPVGLSALKLGPTLMAKHVTWEDSTMNVEEEEEQLLDATEPQYSSLSEVQMIEEDYLHFLSNVFLYFCQTEL